MDRPLWRSSKRGGWRPRRLTSAPASIDTRRGTTAVAGMVAPSPRPVSTTGQDRRLRHGAAHNRSLPAAPPGRSDRMDLAGVFSGKRWRPCRLTSAPASIDTRRGATAVAGMVAPSPRPVPTTGQDRRLRHGAAHNRRLPAAPSGRSDRIDLAGVFSGKGWRPRRLTSAPASIDTVAAFRPWRSFRPSVARGRRGHHRHETAPVARSFPLNAFASGEAILRGKHNSNLAERGGFTRHLSMPRPTGGFAVQVARPPVEPRGSHPLPGAGETHATGPSQHF